MYDATNRSEKSLVSSAVQSPSDASDDERDARVHRALAARDEVGATDAAAGERNGRAPDRHEERDPERQLAEENHAAGPFAAL